MSDILCKYCGTPVDPSVAPDALCGCDGEVLAEKDAEIERLRERIAELEIELDDTNVEYVRCTCLDRARIALRQTGQHHCAQQMEELQKCFDVAGDRFNISPAQPLEIMEKLRVECAGSSVLIRRMFDEKKRSHPTG